MILSIVSCGSLTKDTGEIKGIYTLDSKDALGELEILENDKFNYRYAIGLIDTKSEGTWKIEDKQIILTSDSTYHVNKIKVKEIYNTNSEIKIQFQDNSPVVMANLLINTDSSKVYTTNEKGKIKIPDNTDVSSFTVFYLGESYHYEVTNGKSFLIQLFPADLSKTYFYKRKFYLKENKIIDTDNKWEYYKKR